MVETYRITEAFRPQSELGDRPLLAESGLLIQRFAEKLTAALRSEADIQLILVKGAAIDPKRTLHGK